MTEVQASPTWTPPTGTLGRIVSEAEQRAHALEAQGAELAAQARDAPPAPAFAAALRTNTVGVIAEIKRRSPSKGSINPNISAVDQARAYANGGAAAISVLTEPEHFGGSPRDPNQGWGVPRRCTQAQGHRAGQDRDDHGRQAEARGEGRSCIPAA